jgi:Phage integrase, N-terminal SAM-like domain
MAHELVKTTNSAAVIRRALTPGQFGQVAEVPPELEWLANIPNLKTQRAYKIDVGEFSAFTGLNSPAELRTVTRAHVIAWRKDLEARGLKGASVRRKLSALSSLFDYLCERNAVSGNPVDGVKRPKVKSNEGKTPALGDAQARKLLRRRQPIRSRACAIVRSWPPCSIMPFGARNCAGSRSAICRVVKVLCISRLRARATKFAMSRSIPPFFR